MLLQGREIGVATQITGIGEILMDVFESGSATVGGAPFNVAFQAHQLLSASGRGRGDMVSAVGEDRWGRHILAAVKDASISTEYLAVNKEHPTGIASVFVGGGEAGFEILPDAAWDFLESDAAMDALAKRTNAVAFGSLAQRLPTSGKVIREFVGKVVGHRLFDVNLRQNTTDKKKNYSVEVIDESCKVATIVKTNEVELEEISEMLGFSGSSGSALGSAPGSGYAIWMARKQERLWGQMEQLLKRYGLYAVAVTRGGKGAMLMTEGERVQLEDSRLKKDEIHPVGAGDAFSAGLLYGLTQGVPLATSARLADKLASWVTQYESSTPRLTEAIKAELRAIEEG
jgi:fructokinase